VCGRPADGVPARASIRATTLERTLTMTMHPSLHGSSPVGYEPVEFLDSPGLPAHLAMPTRTVAGVLVPAVGTWVIEPDASDVVFRVRHLGLAKVRGRFDDFAGAIDIAEDPEASSVSVDIAAASVNTHLPARDEHLRSQDFLDVERYPRLTFRSTSVVRTGLRWDVGGDLTLHGVARPVTLAVDFLGAHTDADERDRAMFSATTTLDREDFDLTWNQALEAGGVVIGRTITIELEIEAVRT
jgi:polyisoprenoid-binding protein YceI